MISLLTKIRDRDYILSGSSGERPKLWADPAERACSINWIPESLVDA
jgi:hypothetical protein